MKKTTLLLALSLTLAACTAPANNTADTPSMGKRMPMEWVATDTGEKVGEGDMPVTKITLQVQGTGEEIYSTSCMGTASTEVQDVAGSVASIQCWWAGGGDQYGVFVGDAEQLTVRHRTVDEEAGYGSWEDVPVRP